MMHHPDSRLKHDMVLEPLEAISPLDGRYAAQCAPARQYFSELALIRYRVRIEVEWLRHLAEYLPELHERRDLLAALSADLSTADGQSVKAVEARINHDVKAVEYFLKQRLDALPGGREIREFVHFACTSEDINNLAYALMMREAREQLIVPAQRGIEEQLAELARRYVDLAMLARTHGQPASPTTLGKELAVFVQRLSHQRKRLQAIAVLGKINGAVGNFNAHVAAYPDVDWLAVSESFVARLGLVWNPLTTQIEPHDWVAEFCDALAGQHAVLVDLCRDLWGYVALGYFRQRLLEGEVGSSTMPHKVNPIDFENAEGNLGLAVALLRHFADKLPVSRWQRDLTDSTVLRNLGVAVTHGLLACRACSRGLAKLEADTDRIAADLADNWEVLAEPIQTVMRRYGVDAPYEQLKALTRGRRIDETALRKFIETLDIPEPARRELLALTPERYIGLATALARRGLDDT